jgi:hypothetical protein
MVIKSLVYFLFSVRFSSSVGILLAVKSNSISREKIIPDMILCYIWAMIPTKPISDTLDPTDTSILSGNLRTCECLNSFGLGLELIVFSSICRALTKYI